MEEGGRRVEGWREEKDGGGREKDGGGRERKDGGGREGKDRGGREGKDGEGREESGRRVWTEQKELYTDVYAYCCACKVQSTHNL